MIRNFDPDIPVYSTATMNDRLAEQTTDMRSLSWLIGGFACLAVLLSAIGIYGVMSFVVSQRTQEVGIRIALGAQEKDVLRLMIGQSLKLTILGIVVGLIGAFAVSQFLKGLLFEVEPYDPFVFALISVLTACLGLIACYVPASRATTVDPLLALRNE
jgi:ABC-type antimicrobial peptide transport system permease subunit